jgi:hypothetical protein
MILRVRTLGLKCLKDQLETKCGRMILSVVLMAEERQYDHFVPSGLCYGLVGEKRGATT